MVPTREVDYVGIIKYQKEDSSLEHYHYICGRDSNNSLYADYGNSVNEDAPSNRIRVVYASYADRNRSKCETIPKNRGK